MLMMIMLLTMTVVMVMTRLIATMIRTGLQFRPLDSRVTEWQLTAG